MILWWVTIRPGLSKMPALFDQRHATMANVREVVTGMPNWLSERAAFDKLNEQTLPSRMVCYSNRRVGARA